MKQLYLICSICLSNLAFAQDINFSQFLNALISLNPANTGLLENGGSRINANYRIQWANINNKPMLTENISFDKTILKNKLKNKYLGIGIVAIADQLDDCKIRYNTVGLSVAYHQKLGNKNSVSLGVQPYIINKRLYSPACQIYERSDWDLMPIVNPVFYKPGGKVSLNYLNINAGLIWSGAVGKQIDYHIGVAFKNFSKPKEDFPLLLNQNNINLKYSFSADATLYISEKLDVTTYVLFTKQGIIHNLILGGSGQYKITSKTNLGIGTSYIINNAICPYLFLQKKSSRFSFTYDVSINRNQYSLTRNGAFELSYRYINKYHKN
jgi:type IX secretion system PorP/SprF family membrane protein